MNRLVASGGITEETLAREIGVSPETLARYRNGVEHMPLNRQARLALFVIARAPRFVREGNRLRHQVAAAITYHTQEMKFDRMR